MNPNIPNIPPDFSENLSTLALRGTRFQSDADEHSIPIYLTSSFTAKNAAQAAARFAGTESGNIYSRFSNPTVQAFEQRLALLEGGESCVATASGMAAILTLGLSLLKSGDHVVASQALFGPITNLFKNYFSRWGVQTTFVPPDDLSAWKSACQKNTKLFFLETPSNPLMQLGDIQALSQIAHENGAWLAVDNCFCTPILQKPLGLGADFVIHSATKYIDGQGRCLGGAIVGNQALVGKEVFNFMRTAGPCLSPFNAWSLLKGLETLPLRMREHARTALALAEWLEQQDFIERVYYPGLKSHPQHELAKRQQNTGEKGGFGGIVSFVVKGGREAVWRLIDGVKAMSITANLGDARSTITHPATTTHSRITAEERERAGIVEGLVRISVGLEDLADLQADIVRGF